MTIMGTPIGGGGDREPAHLKRLVCPWHKTLLGIGTKATQRCPACWKVFQATCMRCVHLDELRSRMTGSVCDGCAASEYHLNYGPNSERYSMRDVRYNPQRDGVLPKRNMYRPMRITYGVPFPSED